MRVAVPSISFSQHETLRAELLAEFPDTKFNEEFRRHSVDELTEWLKGRDAVIMGLEPLTAEMLDQLPDLKVVSRMGVGVDNVDPDLLRARGIRMGWTGGTNSLSVAELTISFAIAALRHMAPLNFEMRSGDRPRQRMGRHLSGRVVGLHGCGHVGKQVVRLLQPFDCTVLACDIRDYPEFYREYGVAPVSMEEMLDRVEVLSLHLPLNETTRGLYDDAALDRLSPDSILINTCRGGIIDEQTLKKRLYDGRLAAACMDAFAVEPPTDDDLLNAPNLFATPHIGGSAEEARLAMGRAAIRGLTENALPVRGEPPFD